MNRSLRFRFSHGTAALLDWVIVTPDATISILENLKPFIHSLGDLELVDGRIRARVHPGMYFWHMNTEISSPSLTFQSLAELAPAIGTIVQKHHYLIQKMAHLPDKVHCLWSNIQPNLQDAVTGLETWENFYLTPARYESIKRACALLPTKKLEISFVCRKEDVDSVLHAKEDVVLLECPRSQDYMGMPGLFDPVFEKIT